MDNEGYGGGRIERIKLKRFLTYDYFEIYPRRGLNLVAGYNGTGKSSIVCGICLALGGNTKATGRSTELSEFIKHGCEDAIIEVELDVPGKQNLVVRRQILQTNKSKWFLNKKPVAEEAILKAIKPFNIQTNNICQFLPQEKVSLFSRMDKKQRLQNMLQTIGDENLSVLHHELIAKKEEHHHTELEIKQVKKELQTDENRYNLLKPQADKQRQRKNLLERLQKLEHNKNLLKYHEKRQEYVHMKNSKKKLQEKNDKMLINLTKAKKVTQDVTENCVASMKDADEKEIKIRNRKRDLDNNLTKIRACSGKTQDARMEYRNKMAEKEGQEKKKRELLQLIGAFEKAQPELKQFLQTIDAEMTHIDQVYHQLTEERSVVSENIYTVNYEQQNLKTKLEACRRELEKLKNSEEKKYEKLRRYHQAYEANKWLLQNKHRFKSEIYSPIMTTINVLNRDNCKYIENHINMRDMLAFVCVDPRDCNLLVKILRQELGYVINAVVAPNKSVDQYRSPCSKEQLRQYNLHCFLKDLFTAPDSVMCFLCENYGIHTTPVGDHNAADNIEAIDKDRICRTFYTPDSMYTLKRSRYGERNMLVNSRGINERGLVSSTEDYSEHQNVFEGQIQALNAEQEVSQNKRTDLESQQLNIDREIQKLREKKKSLKDQQETIFIKFKKYELQKDQYGKLQSTFIDENQLKAELIRTMRQINKEKENLFEKHLEIMKDLIKLNVLKRQHILKAYYYSNKETAVKSKEREIATEMAECNRELEAAKIMSDKLFAEAQELLKIAGKMDANVAYHDLEIVEQKIEEIRAQLAINNEADPSVIEDVQRLAESILKKQDDITQFEGKLESISREIDKKKNKWLPALAKHIQRINMKFTSYYKRLNCVGEISLDTTDNSDDFKNYGLQIRLKYRHNEEMTELSHARHSGGECSVAAIIFILSLQELTRVPFRCIDEINQGMDARNERIVFELISESACNETSSQYFLLTPKVLRDLPYNPDITIHVIHNGIHVQPFNGVREILNSRRRFSNNLFSD